MRILVIASSVIGASACPCVWAAQQPASIGQDLAATIALHGLPCDKVVSSQHKGDSDYLATCQNGNRYHIFIDAQGRVVVQKL